MELRKKNNLTVLPSSTRLSNILHEHTVGIFLMVAINSKKFESTYFIADSLFSDWVYNFFINSRRVVSAWLLSLARTNHWIVCSYKAFVLIIRSSPPNSEQICIFSTQLLQSIATLLFRIHPFLLLAGPREVQIFVLANGRAAGLVIF